MAGSLFGLQGPHTPHIRKTRGKARLSKELQAWEPGPLLDPGPAGMYRRTVRGETRIPSFTSSSEVIRSSPTCDSPQPFPRSTLAVPPAIVVGHPATISTARTAGSLFDAIE